MIRTQPQSLLSYLHRMWTVKRRLVVRSCLSQSRNMSLALTLTHNWQMQWFEAVTCKAGLACGSLIQVSFTVLIFTRS